MKMKSIRLDFPAHETNGLANAELTRLLGSALMDAAHNGRFKPSAEPSLTAMARATVRATVDEYDDRHGGPVFYIP